MTNLFTIIILFQLNFKYSFYKKELLINVQIIHLSRIRSNNSLTVDFPLCPLTTSRGDKNTGPGTKFNNSSLSSDGIYNNFIQIQ
jgi:hypothetical protein